jgi:hypothetical protein
MDKSKFNNPREWRKFGFGLSGILTVLTVLQVILHRPGWKVFTVLTFLTLIASWLWVRALKPVFIAFSYLGSWMGLVMTRVILCILFYLVFTPIGVLSRLFNKEFLTLRFNRKASSNWISRQDENDVKSRYENQF